MPRQQVRSLWDVWNWKNKTGMNRLFCIAMFAFCAGALSAQDVSWPEISLDAKPAARWWWMGSAVDKENLTRNLEAYAAAGKGTMGVTPVFGGQGNWYDGDYSDLWRAGKRREGYSVSLFPMDADAAIYGK